MTVTSVPLGGVCRGPGGATCIRQRRFKLIHRSKDLDGGGVGPGEDQAFLEHVGAGKPGVVGGDSGEA